MNFFQDLISNLQNLVAQVPEIIQPLVIMLAGAIPAIEGDIAAVIGIVGGLNPVVAGLAGAAGNFATVLLTVLLTSRARSAIVNRRERVNAAAGAMESTAFGSSQPATAQQLAAATSTKPESKGRAKGRERLNNWFVRFGVPGASLLGPLALPTQVTSAILVASGSPRAWVLLWQAAAIVLWTTISSVSAWLALTVVFLV
ncbi:small multidrug efflux protein [Microbacterium sp. A94]|uniref:small multidrug efflux protein n=1 Tax=Microbacterium sp. A94 TaxID=3450717 RepID=UPI003F41BF2F